MTHLASRAQPAWSVDDASVAWSTRRLRRRLVRDGIEGFNFFGHLTANLGLGMAARNTLEVLQSRGVPVALSDVDPGNGRGGTVLTHCASGADAGNQGLHSVNLFHLNPPEIFYQLWRNQSIARRNRLNVCVLFWELEELPEEKWADVLATMDLVLAPTAYIADAVRRALPDTPCLPLPQSVHLPVGIRPDRKRWGLPANATVFVASFDIASDVARKNPLGAVAAFQGAFPGRSDVRLVLKTQPNADEHLLRVQSPVVAAALQDPRIVLVQEALPYDEVLSLYASADAYVSLHRSEGLGLGPMEAMALGVPVVATAYSGPMDFLTHENSILVGFDHVPVQSDNPAYAVMNGRTDWAEPRLNEAVEALRQLAGDPHLRKTLGLAAKEDMQRRQTRALAGETFSLLERRLREDDALWARHSERFTRLRDTTTYRRRIRSAGQLRHVVAVAVKRRWARART